MPLHRLHPFRPRSLALLAAERATVLAAVPTMYAWLATSPRLTEFDLSSLRILTSAASSLPVEHARRVRERLPQARLYVMYGQTECKRISFLDPDDLERKPGSVGRGMPFQEHAVVDEEGRPVAAGESGELVVRGPHVMVGYWRKPELTAWKLRSCATPGETWLHTDDLFRLDEDGFLYFVGRRDDILRGGAFRDRRRRSHIRAVIDVLLDQIGHDAVARAGGDAAHDNGDDVMAITAHGGEQIEARGARVAGLDAVHAFDAAEQMNYEVALGNEATLQRGLGRAHDFAEGVAAFQAKRAPRFTDR